MKSVVLAFALLESVAEHGPVGVSELARLHDVPKSTAQRSLATLAKLGWIRRAPDGEATRWMLTGKALTVGGRVANVADLRAAALPAMQELSRLSGETIHLSIPEGLEVVLIEKIEATRTVRAVSWVGGRAPIHASASGKAILATMSTPEVVALLQGNLRSFTSLTVTDLDVLLAEIEEVRELGYAVNPGQWRDDVAAVGAAITFNGRAVASVSISTPAIRSDATLHGEYGTQVQRAAQRISAELSGS